MLRLVRKVIISWLFWRKLEEPEVDLEVITIVFLVKQKEARQCQTMLKFDCTCRMSMTQISIERLETLLYVLTTSTKLEYRQTIVKQ